MGPKRTDRKESRGAGARSRRRQVYGRTEAKVRFRRDPATGVIVRSVPSIGRQMGLDVIAEGVETAWQRDHLADPGYRYAQGYCFARPMPGDELQELLEDDEGDASVDEATDGSDA